MIKILKYGFIAVFLAGVAIMTLGKGENKAKAPESINIPMPTDLSQKDQALAHDSLQLLIYKCPGLAQNWTQVKNPIVEILPPEVAENFGLAKSRGWGRMVRLTVTVKDDAKLPTEWRAWGHTITFDVGGGNKPGIHVMKDQAARFCGGTHGDTVFDVMK